MIRSQTRALSPISWIAALALWASATAAVPPKTATASGRLLLPHFLVDTVNPNGATTLFAVRNEGLESAQIRIDYYQKDRTLAQPPQHSEAVELAAKQVRTIQVRQVLAELEADEDGFARGYAVIVALTPGAALQGDYFQLTPGQAFATGHRLVNADPQSPHNELCSNFSIRFLNGGAFDGGTEFTFWLDLDHLPAPGEPALFYSVYSEEGALIFSSELPSQEVSFKQSAASLVAPIPTNFGAMEFEIPAGTGHLSAVMSALGQFSVGFEASCRD